MENNCSVLAKKMKEKNNRQYSNSKSSIHFPILAINSKGEISLIITNTGGRLLICHCYTRSLSWQSTQIMGISNIFTFLMSQLITVTFEPLLKEHSFLLWDTTPSDFIIKNLLYKKNFLIKCSPDDFFLKFLMTLLFFIKTELI